MIRRLWKSIHRPDGIVLRAGFAGAPITSSAAPLPQRSVDINPRPEARCCPCCQPPCRTPNQHRDACEVVGHEPSGAA